MIWLILLFYTLQLFTQCYFLFLLPSSFPAAVIGTRLHIAVAVSCMSMAFYLVFLKWQVYWLGGCRTGLNWAWLLNLKRHRLDNVCSNPQRPFLKHKQILPPSGVWIILPLTSHLTSLQTTPCQWIQTSCTVMMEGRKTRPGLKYCWNGLSVFESAPLMLQLRSLCTSFGILCAAGAKSNIPHHIWDVLSQSG